MSAELTSKYGFSVVAPMSVTTPSSMAGSRASCCALLKRWISSMKRTVRAAVRVRASRAPWMAARTSAVPELTAESCTRRAPVSAAMSRASVVLPQPGGPKKSMLKSCAALDRGAQHRARPDDVLLAGELRERARPHARRQRRLGRDLLVAQGEEVVLGQSTPARAGPSRARFLLPSPTMRKVLVLNTTYEPLNVCSVRRALVLLLKDKAEVLEQSGAAFRSEHAPSPVPPSSACAPTCASRAGAAPARISRRAVFARDRHRCQYCGSERHLTVDHVVPRSKGGPDTWDNLVTSCAPCNRKKGDRPAHAAGLRLTRPPRPPEPAAFVLLHVDHIHESWRPYLSFAT